MSRSGTPIDTRPPSESARAPAARVSCSHCALPVPRGLIEGGAEFQFCCHGCRTAYALLHDAGLGHYYSLRDKMEAGTPTRVNGSGHRYDELNDPAFITAFTRDVGDGVRETEFVLEGVHCAACVWLIERLPRVCPGVVESRLNFRRAVVTVSWDAGEAELSRVASALDSLGYAPHPVRGAKAAEIRRKEDRAFLVRVGVAGALAGNVMLMTMPMYGVFLTGMAEEYERLFRWLAAALGALCVFWPGRVFFRGAMGALRARSPNLDVPIALALLAGTVWGAINAVLNRGEVYFDSLAMLTFLLLVGRWIQHRQQRSAADAVELLFTMTPTRAARVETDAQGRETIRTVPIEAVAAGDVVEVRAGDSVPADGAVVFGTSDVDEALLTGESRPQRVCVGRAVAAGSVNLTSPIRVRVEATGEQARIGKLMRLVAESAERRSPIVRFTDKVSGYFVMTVVTLAALTCAGWLFIDPAHAMEHTIALLIVTCPCALGLATPLVLTVRTGRLARRGLLVKGADALERLAKPASKPGVCFLDKTGTVTEGRMRVVGWLGDAGVRPMVAALEAGSTQPVARALAAEHSEEDPPVDIAGVQQTHGLGICGYADMVPIAAGSSRFMSELGLAIPPALTRDAADGAARALTPVFVALDGRVVAAALVGDAIRADAAEAINALQRAGWHVRLLSGDRREVAQSVAAAVGISEEDVLAEQTPELKVAAVRAAMAGDTTVLMVGDGVNDAAALAEATVGVAVRGGAEASLDAADVYADREGLSPLLELLAGAQGAMMRIRVSLGASLTYNTVAGSLAIAGLINPLLAAIIMPASSLTVLGIAASGWLTGRETKRGAANAAPRRNERSVP